MGSGLLAALGPGMTTVVLASSVLMLADQETKMEALAEQLVATYLTRGGKVFFAPQYKIP